MREQVLYREKYRRGTACLRADCLPQLRHTPWPVERAELLEAGRVRTGDGTVSEFHVVKVYLKAPDEEGPCST